MNKTPGRILSWVSALGLFAVGFVVWTQSQAINDWLRLRDYQPPAQIAQLASDTTMNDEGKKLFYVYHPELNDRTSFSRRCDNHGEQSIVLGCYVSLTGIYLFDVDDPRLAGVEQVTAAHEMLHVAYERLAPDERAKVDGLTAKTFANVTDERIISTVENYRKSDPSIVPNELHSILATEVRNLPEELEEYYRRYFNDRQKIVSYSEKYESVVTARRNRAAALETQITGLKDEITQLEEILEAQRNGLQILRPTVDTQEEVNTYNARVVGYNSGVNDLNSMIERHNQLIEEYEKNALEQEELFQSLDSRPTL